MAGTFDPTRETTMKDIIATLVDELRRAAEFIESMEMDATPQREALAAFDAAQVTRSEPAGAHSEEPWRVGYLSWPAHDTGSALVIDSAGMFRPCAVYGDGSRNAGTTEANARRIVACVNACAGIPTELLESLQPGQLDVEIHRAAAAQG